MSTNRQPDSKPTVRENGIFRGALKSVLTKTNSSKRGDVIRLAVAVNLPVDAADSGEKN